MKRTLLVLTMMALPSMSMASDNDLEQQFWNHASASQSLETVQVFIQSFPNSEYIEEAKALAATLEDKKRRREFEELIFGIVGDVRFDSPLGFGSEDIIGRSIADVLKSSPSFPPIDGLPEQYWKGQNCSSCHQWTREDLCVQASTYVKKDSAKYQTKQHPFGGLFKMNLRIWADGGCK